MINQNLKQTMEDRLSKEVTNYIKTITAETIMGASNINVDEVFNNIDNSRLYRTRREFLKRIASDLSNIEYSTTDYNISFYEFLITLNNDSILPNVRNGLLEYLRHFDLVDDINCLANDIVKSYNTYISNEIQLLKLTKILIDFDLGDILYSIGSMIPIINIPDVMNWYINSDDSINGCIMSKYIRCGKIAIDLINDISSYLDKVHSIYIEDLNMLIRNYIHNEYTTLYNMIDRYIIVTTSSYIDRCVDISPSVIVVDRRVIYDTIFEFIINAFIVSDINKIDIDLFDIFTILDETCIL